MAGNAFMGKCLIQIVLITDIAAIDLNRIRCCIINRALHIVSNNRVRGNARIEIFRMIGKGRKRREFISQLFFQIAEDFLRCCQGYLFILRGTAHGILQQRKFLDRFLEIACTDIKKLLRCFIGRCFALQSSLIICRTIRQIIDTVTVFSCAAQCFQ